MIRSWGVESCGVPEPIRFPCHTGGCRNFVGERQSRFCAGCGHPRFAPGVGAEDVPSATAVPERFRTGFRPFIFALVAFVLAAMMIGMAVYEYGVAQNLREQLRKERSGESDSARREEAEFQALETELEDSEAQ